MATKELSSFVTTKDAAAAAGGDLAPGDVYARRVVLTSDRDAELRSSSRSNTDDKISFLVASTAADDPFATFVDPLFGARGETPTTVVQWSKGTIF